VKIHASRLKQFYGGKYQIYIIQKKKELKEKIIFCNALQIFPCCTKAHSDEYGGRILLGDNDIGGQLCRSR